MLVNGGEAGNGTQAYGGYFQYFELSNPDEITYSIDPILILADGTVVNLADGVLGTPTDVGGGIVRSEGTVGNITIIADTELVGRNARTTFNFQTTGTLADVSFVFFSEIDLYDFTDDVALFTGSIATGDLVAIQDDTASGGLSLHLSGEAGSGATASFFGSGLFDVFGLALEAGDLSVLSFDGSNFAYGPGDLGTALAFGWMVPPPR